MPKPLTVLVTAVGCPGAAALLRALRAGEDAHGTELEARGEEARGLRLVGVDMSERSVGRHICDVFELVPPGNDPAFADSILEICRREQVDAILPQSSFTLDELALNRERFGGIAVIVSSIESIRRCNDKAETYAMLDAIGVKGPAWRLVRGSADLEKAARELGYPERDVCMKPLFSSGSRGFRRLSASADRREQLLTGRPGVAEALRLEEAAELIGRSEIDLLVMELAIGTERTIDGYAEHGEILLGHPKTREAMRAGLAMYFETLDDPALMNIAARVVAELHLDGFFNVQLVGEHVIEINPRISTIVYQEDLNIPYLGVRRALGEISADELRSYASRVRPTRRTLRFFDQVDWDE